MCRVGEANQVGHPQAVRGGRAKYKLDEVGRALPDQGRPVVRTRFVRVAALNTYHQHWSNSAMIRLGVELRARDQERWSEMSDWVWLAVAFALFVLFLAIVALYPDEPPPSNDEIHWPFM
jgi:hypothetical protein